jgi:hypothetical protein
MKSDFGSLIAQPCDGTTVISGEKGGVQTIIKETYKNANFIQCYAQQLNLIMVKSNITNQQVRIFLAVCQKYQPSFAISTVPISA